MPAEAAGITPAYAGKTEKKRPKLHGSKDHPRVCGKDPTDAKTQLNVAGSPPRMRERLIASVSMLTNARITPAYAGKTL